MATEKGKTMTRHIIPAYTIQDLELFTPIGEWCLVATQDHTEVLAVFNGASLRVAEPISLPNSLTDEATLILEAA